MPIPILNPRELCEHVEQVELTEQAGLTSATLTCPEEVLVRDARSGLTPSQMVDQKLQAALGSHYRGIFHQPTGRPRNVRRTAAK